MQNIKKKTDAQFIKLQDEKVHHNWWPLAINITKEIMKNNAQHVNDAKRTPLRSK